MTGIVILTNSLILKTDLDLVFSAVRDCTDVVICVNKNDEIFTYGHMHKVFFEILGGSKKVKVVDMDLPADITPQILHTIYEHLLGIGYLYFSEKGIGWYLSGTPCTGMDFQMSVNNNKLKEDLMVIISSGMLGDFSEIPASYASILARHLVDMKQIQTGSSVWQTLQNI